MQGSSFDDRVKFLELDDDHDQPEPFLSEKLSHRLTKAHDKMRNVRQRIYGRERAIRELEKWLSSKKK